MASFPTFNSPQQIQRSPITLCKYPSSFSFKSHYLVSHVFPISTLKYIFQEYPSYYTLKATFCSKSNARMSSVEHQHSPKTINSTTNRELSNEFSPLRSRDEMVGKKAKNSSVGEDKMGKKYRRDGYVRQDGFSSLRSKDGKVEVKSKKTEVRAVVDEKMATVSKKTKESSNSGKEKMDKNPNRTKGDNQVGEGETKKKRSRKAKVETPETQLRARLDMCSKRGDFLTAISLYDTAQREGVNLGQYHYTVLLYLCSSAAVGIVRPAKSGSGSRTSDKLDLMNDVPSVESVDLTGNGSDRFDSVASSNGFLLDSSSLKLDGCVSSESETVNNVCLDKVIVYENTDELEQKLYDKSTEGNHQISNGFIMLEDEENDFSGGTEGSSNKEDHKIQVSEDVKRYALMRGFEIYEKMCLDKIPLNEATLTSVARMAMSMGNGNMALEMVDKMKEMGINPRLRSYGPALFTFCKSGDIEKAFMVEEHMLENGVYPEEPELEALLRISVEAGRGDKVYYLLHKLRKSIRKVSPSTADLIDRWFSSQPATRVGKRNWDQRVIMEAMENGGGGWHGQGWLGKGRWTTARAFIESDGVCGSCGDKLVTIDLDPTETENFAKSVASIAAKRERHSSFQNFQNWLDYYGPFEAVVDAANVGLFSQRTFSPSKVNAIVNGIRQKLPSKKWPLIVLHNRRITGGKMDERANKILLEKWKNADALYATPNGSNDDWYWLYAAIKFKCLLVTNDEMRDHIFQLLGNDFFPRWKERHQVRFSFGDSGPEFTMPPPCSVVIQESEKGHWHIPIELEDGSERERSWLCVTRSDVERGESSTRQKENTEGRSRREMKLSNRGKLKGNHSNLKTILSESLFPNDRKLISEIDEAEEVGGCIIDFQI